MAERPGWCISLFMPTHRSGEDTRQDPIRMVNLLRQAEEQLIEKGMRTVDARTMLEPARKLEGYSPFWRHLNDGLAMYLAEGVFRYYALPMPFEEQLIVAEHFYIKPLLPLLSGDGRFYVLALSQNEVRLLEGSRYSVGEVDLEGAPSSLAELLGDEKRDKQLQFHTRGSSGAGKRPAMFFGHGEAEEQAKQDILRYFRLIDAELRGLLPIEGTPLVLAGVDYLLPLYRSISSYPYLLEDGITGNPEQLSDKQLHEPAWKIVAPYFQEIQHKARTRFYELKDTGQTSINLEEIIPAAYHGRVDHLFVALDVQRWGKYTPDLHQVSIHPEAQPGDEELLQFASNYTILNGGSVFAVEKERLPGEGILAAIYRY
ncbi:MAG: hypothetical protein JXB15_07010 [Anaerolineales bacterium]|nr:hypothetical protein [Anaerolineales bacterium]